VFVHFAFGSLGKQGRIAEQTTHVIELILAERRLLISRCKEFIPVLPKGGAKSIPSEMFEITGKGEVSVTFPSPKKDPNWYDRLPDSKEIHYLPIDVSMICFTKITFNQLSSSNHHAEYGKCGLVFSGPFLKSKGIRPVTYYTESSLWNDELIKTWNQNQKGLSKKDKKDLEREIVIYRKPANLFSSFRQSKHRIAFDENAAVDYLYFSEKDLFMVITPDLESKRRLESFFESNWSCQPKINIYPG